MRRIVLAGEVSVPVLGLGTWGWGEDSGRRSDEVAALRCSLDLGLSLVDTEAFDSGVVLLRYAPEAREAIPG